MAEGGEINLDFLGEDGYDDDGYDDDGYDKYGYDKYGYDKDGNDKDGNVGYNEDGYDKYGFDKYGYDKDGKMFEQGEGEHFPLLPRTSTSSTRETQRPFKPRVRTSTRKEVSFANPSYHVTDGDEIETSFGGIRGGIPNIGFNEELREEVKKYFPNMDDSAVEVELINGRLSVRLIGIGNEKWTPIFKKDGKLSIQFNKGLKKALGFNREKIINAKNLESLTRLEELEKDLDREDISEEVRNTTLNEINELKEGIAEGNKEIEAIQNPPTSLKERIKEIFKKYGFTITSVVTAVGVVIGVIVSNLSSGLSKMAKGVASGLKDIGGKLAQILPGIVGAIASFIFKTAGEVISFLAENAWILVVAVVVYLVERLKKKNRR